MVDSKFKEAIAQRNYPTVRNMLKNRLLLDHDVTGGMFAECWAECERAGIVQDLYQPHDGRALPGTPSEANVNTLLGQLATNFSRERLDCALKMAQAVWPSEQTAAKPKSTVHTTGERIISETPVAQTGHAATSGRVVGEERILSETELDTGDDSAERDEEFRRGSTRSSEASPVPGVAIAVVAIAAAAVVVGVLIFG